MSVSIIFHRLFRITFVILFIYLSHINLTHAIDTISSYVVSNDNRQHQNTNSAISKKLTNHLESSTIKWVNRYYNRYAHGNDLSLWGVEEYWTTPNELMAMRSGDCEDVAIAKFYFLLRMGVSEDRLRFAYVKAFNQKKMSIEDHLVLLYRTRKYNKVLVLDSLTDKVHSTLKRQDLSFQYAFNRKGVWPMNTTLAESQILQSSIIRSWQKLLLRMR